MAVPNTSRPLRRSTRRRAAAEAINDNNDNGTAFVPKKIKMEETLSIDPAHKTPSKATKKKVKSEKVKMEPNSSMDAKQVKTKKKSKKEPKKKPKIDTSRPTPEECRYATKELSKLHPQVVNRNSEIRKTLLESCGMRDSITDSIISTMLSQNTTDANAKNAFRNLKKSFPTWDLVASLDASDDGGGGGGGLMALEDSIRVAGLAKTRAARIHAMLQEVKRERGVPSMDYITSMTDEEVKTELSRFKGLGPKTISCVLLFALGRDEFPVDTHVNRITQQMGWVPKGTSRENTYLWLNERIPNDVKMDLHCLLVSHGKCCHRCAANGKPQFPPKGGKKLDCPLANVAKWGGMVPKEVKEEATDAIKSSKLLEKEEDHTLSMSFTSGPLPDEIKSEDVNVSSGLNVSVSIKSEYLLEDGIKSEEL